VYRLAFLFVGSASIPMAKHATLQAKEYHYDYSKGLGAVSSNGTCLRLG